MDAITQPDTGMIPTETSSLSESLARIVDRLTSPQHHQRLAEREAAQARRDAERQAADIAERAASVWQCAGERYRRCTLENFELNCPAQRDVLDKLRAYAQRLEERVTAGMNVSLIGPPGTGKDHLLAGLVHIALSKGLAVAWRDGAELWLDLWAAVDEHRQLEVVRELTRPIILVLSDPVPPHVVPTNYQRALLYVIIHGRYKTMRPTWVSLNAASRADAEERLGAAVADRLRHGALSVVCNWPSYRAPTTT